VLLLFSSSPLLTSPGLLPPAGHQRSFVLILNLGGGGGGKGKKQKRKKKERKKQKRDKGTNQN